MKNLLTLIPNGHYELKFFAEDDARDRVAAFAVSHGAQTGPEGPVEPTGKTIAADYVYVMEFEGTPIRRMTKIWNVGISLQQLGWALFKSLEVRQKYLQLRNTVGIINMSLGNL